MLLTFGLCVQNLALKSENLSPQNQSEPCVRVCTQDNTDNSLLYLFYSKRFTHLTKGSCVTPKCCSHIFHYVMWSINPLELWLMECWGLITFMLWIFVDLPDLCMLQNLIHPDHSLDKCEEISFWLQPRVTWFYAMLKKRLPAHLEAVKHKITGNEICYSYSWIHTKPTFLWRLLCKESFFILTVVCLQDCQKHTSEDEWGMCKSCWQ